MLIEQKQQARGLYLPPIRRWRRRDADERPRGAGAAEVVIRT